jgi:hypothetical protein
MEKTYVFDSAGSVDPSTLIASLMQNRGVDPNLMAMLTNASRNQDQWGGGCWWIWIIMMFWLWGGNGGYGFGNNGLPAQLNNDFGRDILLQAINGNATAISQLASTLNCDVNALQGAINQVQSSIQSVGAQVGMSSQQIINAVQANTCQLSSQIAQCCCDVRNTITQQGYENQIATLNQTNVLSNTMNSNNQAILARLDAMSNQALLDKIDALRERNSALTAQLSNEHQTAAIQAYQAQSLIPVNAALNALQSEVNNIKCKIPETITIPANTGTYLTPCQSTLIGLSGIGYPGFINNGSIWS